VRFIAELPKTPSHKIAKHKVRELAQGEYREIWDCEAHGIRVRRPATVQDS